LGFQLIKLSPWRLLSRPSQAIIEEYWWGTQLLTRRELQDLFSGVPVEEERALGMAKSYYVAIGAPGTPSSGGTFRQG
jgi:hypothetical protein